ncbi:hypothetical protein AO361_18645 [Pseudomonas fluorescens]|jgi:hypothetical protein|uniref:hypothetical protein n=1 Tax=Pseudomonas TaxID=286 RepID=UPI00070A5F92|nr:MULTISPECIES: hypothetical protein [Pseudomonas]OOQ45098.1 hypothetical protein AO361_18645 [Pseudomonas fluorescens]
MPNFDLLPSLLLKINENQLALEAAILELSNWVEQRGSAEVADNVRDALEAIDRLNPQPEADSEPKTIARFHDETR